MTAISATSNRKPPIFLHSGFRASSTWMWSKFRVHENLLCYYEPLNEQLGGLTLENIRKSSPSAWRSHHPSGDPYDLEYANLLGDGIGVDAFPSGQDFSNRYIGAAGPEGALDDDVAAYIKVLIDHSYAQRRRPLLACTRSLGRSYGLRQTFGGYHILLIRNLFQQWNSYAGQARFGNWYFLQTLYKTMTLADRDPAIAYLSEIFSEESRASFKRWVALDNFDGVFCYFVGFYLYFLTLAKRSADLVVDVNALAVDVQYRRKIVACIADEIGISLDLDDAREEIDFPLRAIADRSACMARIDDIAGTVKSLCRTDLEEQIFIDARIATLWTEQAAFQRHTAGATEYIAELETKLEDAQKSLLNPLKSCEN